MVLGIPHFKSNLRNTQLFASKIVVRICSNSIQVVGTEMRGVDGFTDPEQHNFHGHVMDFLWCSLNSFNAKRRCKPSNMHQRAQKAHETFVGIC